MPAKCSLEVLFASWFSIKVFIRWCGSFPYPCQAKGTCQCLQSTPVCLLTFGEKLKYVQSQIMPPPLKCRQSIPTNPSMCHKTRSLQGCTAQNDKIIHTQLLPIFTPRKTHFKTTQSQKWSPTLSAFSVHIPSLTMLQGWTVPVTSDRSGAGTVALHSPGTV